MTDIITDLITDLHTSFLQMYHANSSSHPGAPLLAYEPIGIPVSDAMFKANPTDTAYNANLALERFSNLTNVIGVVSEGTFQDTGRKLDNMLEELVLSPAMPASGSAADVFGHIKSDALKRFDPTLGSSILDKSVPFHATYPTPSNWYDQTVAGNWPTYRSDAAKTTVPPIGPRPPVPISFRQGWQVLPTKLAPVLTRPADTETPVAKEILATRVGISPIFHTQHLAFSAPGFVSTTAMMREPIAAIVASPTQLRAISPSRELSTAVLSNTTSQPVATNKMSISFEYCLVTAERDWLSDAFLLSKGWYVPGMKAGDISTGTVDNNTGLVPFLPIAMIVVRNLNIAGSWTAEDATALNNAAALGPFNLMGRTINQQSSSLSCSGMQLLAWLCEVQPLLPPESDPALSTATSTPAVTNTAIPVAAPVPAPPIPAPAH